MTNVPEWWEDGADATYTDHPDDGEDYVGTLVRKQQGWSFKYTTGRWINYQEDLQDAFVERIIKKEEIKTSKKRSSAGGGTKKNARVRVKKSSSGEVGGEGIERVEA